MWQSLQHFSSTALFLSKRKGYNGALNMRGQFNDLQRKCLVVLVVVYMFPYHVCLLCLPYLDICIFYIHFVKVLFVGVCGI